MNPYFSIITPSYNRADFLKKTINSVISQKFKNWEYIIIDDASTDNSEEIIKSFKDERIIYLKNKNNKERGYSRNKGISSSKGKYICFLDSDDELLDNHLDILHKNIQNHNEEVALFFTKSLQIIGNNPIEKRPYKGLNKNEDIFEYIMLNTFNHNCVSVHKSIFKTCQFDETIPGLEDIDLWLHIAIDFPIYSIDEYTNVLNFHDGSYTLGGEKRFLSEIKKFKIIFNKKKLQKSLPNKAKKQLLCRCHYFLGIIYFEKKEKMKSFKHIIKSFLLNPKGANSNANKTMGVIAIYMLPLFGFVIKKLVKIIK